jgi:8-oxo-dGTP pyrophosphatase MutT (NUDIX family)
VMESMKWVEEEAGIDGSFYLERHCYLILPIFCFQRTFLWLFRYAELTVNIVYRRICAASFVGKMLPEYSVEECVHRDENSG